MVEVDFYQPHLALRFSFLFYAGKLPPETHQSTTPSFRLHMHRGSPLLFFNEMSLFPTLSTSFRLMAIGGNIIHSYRLLLLTLSRNLKSTVCKISVNCILIQVSNQLDDVGWFCRTHIVELKGYACQSPTHLWTSFP